MTNICRLKGFFPIIFPHYNNNLRRLNPCKIYCIMELKIAGIHTHAQTNTVSQLLHRGQY